MDNPLNLPNSTSARRKVLYSLVATTCIEAGFSAAENHVLDVLVQLLQSFLTELSNGSKQYCEHAGRTEPLAADVFMALIEMGFDVKSLPAYPFRQNRIIVPAPSQLPKQTSPKILQTGEKRPHHNNIPDSFPSFPDSHSYISTPTYKQPITDYETLRMKSSSHKRDVERGLTRFMARTFSSTLPYSLFADEQLHHLFPLIGIKNDPVPYLSALLPKDQIWEEDDQDELQTNSKKLKSVGKTSTDKQVTTTTTTASIELNVSKEITDGDNDLLPIESELIDNVYIRPPKIVNHSSFEF